MFNLLVVEDDPHVRSLIKAILTDEGYNCITASDGIDALDAMDNHHVDLAIVDIMMPRMDGYEFTKTLRDGKCEIPIAPLENRNGEKDNRRLDNA